MIAYSRAATAAFVYIPAVFAWGALRHPWIAALAAAAATVEARWVVRRAWRLRTSADPLLIGVDAGFCLALMLIGSRAADPANRNVLMTVLLPFSLVCPALIGFGFGVSRRSAALLLVLATTWVVSVHPNYTLKLASDMLGFALWFVVALLIARELRDLAARTAEAQAMAAEMQRVLAERDREAAVLRERTAAHREIHDYLLPIVERMAHGENDPGLSDEAWKGVRRARRFLTDGDPGEATPFGALIDDIRESFADDRMPLVCVMRIHADPPAEAGEAVAAATREALNNARKHAGTGRPVNLYVEAAEDGVEVTVRDRGVGFDPGRVTPRGGLGSTFPALRQVGGEVVVKSRPGEGAKIIIRWPVGDDAAGDE
jgi:signal transduction histidine kinase